jgi:hypothetical protein
MAANRELQLQNHATLESVFYGTTALLSQVLGRKAFRIKTAINAAILDSVMVGTAERIARGPITDLEAFRANYQQLLQDPAYLPVVSRATADEEYVRTRLALARKAFVDVP